ncbi:hypothetical protein [Belnapia moabensis]|uniref:hypothetical protein n=1 Tax=Belnapia moabensis TaxID=365533 RepID=UPI0005BC4C65|nr:hypothetical protein [Belnapia moabensis]
MSILSRIAAAIQAVATTFQATMQWVWNGTKMTLRVVTSPVRVLAGLGSGGGGAGPSTVEAAAMVQMQAQQQSQQAEQAMSVAQTVRLLQRAAKLRSEGRDLEPLAEALAPGWLRYVESLSTGEAHRLAETDVRAVGELVSGARDGLPGVRGPKAVALGDMAPRTMQDAVEAKIDAEPERTPEQQQVLGGLRARFLAAGYKPRDEPKADRGYYYDGRTA